MADTGIFAWLDRAESCGDRDVERAALVMKDYYQGVGPEPEYAEQALASRPAEVDDEGLPALPESAKLTIYELQREPYFTAEQYRQGQRDAVAADRARRESIDGQLHSEPTQSNDLPCLLCNLNHGRGCWAHKIPSHTTNKEK